MHNNFRSCLRHGRLRRPHIYVEYGRGDAIRHQTIRGAFLLDTATMERCGHA